MNTPNDCSDETINQLFDLAVALSREQAEEAKHLNAETYLGNKPLPGVLRVGDRVAWRGGWGLDAPRMTRVRLIEIDCNALAENGEVVGSCSWDVARKPTTVVDLENGRWAYGDQIYPDMLSAQAKAMP